MVQHRVKVLDDKPPARPERRDQPARQRRPEPAARTGQTPGMGPSRTRPGPADRRHAVVPLNFQLAQTVALYPAGVDVGRQHITVGTDPLRGHPPGDRTAASADLWAPPASRNPPEPIGEPECSGSRLPHPGPRTGRPSAGDRVVQQVSLAWCPTAAAVISSAIQLTSQQTGICGSWGLRCPARPNRTEWAWTGALSPGNSIWLAAAIVGAAPAIRGVRPGLHKISARRCKTAASSAMSRDRASSG